MLYYTILYYAVVWYGVDFHFTDGAVLHNFMKHCDMFVLALKYNMLHCHVLCYAMLWYALPLFMAILVHDDKVCSTFLHEFVLFSRVSQQLLSNGLYSECSIQLVPVVDGRDD